MKKVIFYIFIFILLLLFTFSLVVISIHLFDGGSDGGLGFISLKYKPDKIVYLNSNDKVLVLNSALFQIDEIAIIKNWSFEVLYSHMFNFEIKNFFQISKNIILIESVENHYIYNFVTKETIITKKEGEIIDIKYDKKNIFVIYKNNPNILVILNKKNLEKKKEIDLKSTFKNMIVDKNNFILTNNPSILVIVDSETLKIKQNIKLGLNYKILRYDDNGNIYILNNSEILTYKFKNKKYQYVSREKIKFLFNDFYITPIKKEYIFIKDDEIVVQERNLFLKNTYKIFKGNSSYHYFKIYDKGCYRWIFLFFDEDKKRLCLYHFYPNKIFDKKIDDFPKTDYWEKRYNK